MDLFINEIDGTNIVETAHNLLNCSLLSLGEVLEQKLYILHALRFHLLFLALFQHELMNDL